MTYAWACATNGALDAAQRRAVNAAIRAGYLDIARGLLRWPFVRRPPAELPAAPDSKLARQAESAATDQGPALAGHGYRTWLVGVALADRDRASLDQEQFYVAALLHDAGMASEVLGEDFTIRSARIVLDVSARAEAGEATGARLADAVVAHATPGLAAADDPIGYYVQAGAMADLAGLRMWDLPKGYLRAAYTAHPGHGVHRVVPDLIRREARDVPEGRFALLRRAGMDRMVQVSPTRRFGG
jgi:hypothetical protein